MSSRANSTTISAAGEAVDNRITAVLLDIIRTLLRNRPEVVADLETQGVVAKVFCDSQSGIYLAKNQVYHERTKHIDVKPYFVREVISKGRVKLENVSTMENPADMLTKSLPSTKFKYCTDLLHLEEDKDLAKVENC